MNAVGKWIVIILLSGFFLTGCTRKQDNLMEWQIKPCDIDSFEGLVQEIELISDSELYVLAGISTSNGVCERIYYINLNTKKVELIPLELEKNVIISNLVNLGHDMYAAFLAEQDDEVDLRKTQIIIANKDGNVISKCNISEIICEDEPIKLIALTDGNMLLITTECVYCMDKNLNKIKEYKTKMRTKDALLMGDEKIMCASMDENINEVTVQFSILNLTTGEWEKDFSAEINEYEQITRILNESDSTFLIFSTKGMYRCDENGKTTFLIRYDEHTLEETVWYRMVVFPNGKFFSSSNDYDMQRSSIGYLELEAVKKQKNKIVVGGIFIDKRIVRQLQEFNKSNSDVIVEIKEYECDLSSVDSMNAACSRLNADIISGNGPDIIYLQGLDRKSLVQQGLLEKLDTYFEKDDKISKEDIIPSFLEAISEEGSIYYLVPSFAIYTLAGKASIVGDSMGWTMKELYDLKNKGDYDVFLKNGSSEFGLMIMGLVQNENVSVEDLKLALKMTKTEDANTYMSEKNAGLKNDNVILAPCGMTQPFYIQLTHSMFNEEEITLKGFPGVKGSGAMFLIDVSLGISSKSKQKDIAWEVIRPLITKDFQSVKKGLIPYFPTRIDCFEEMLQEYSREKSKFNKNLGTTLSNNEDKAVITALSKKDIERIRRMVFDTRTVYDANNVLMNIATEEANAFFAGDKNIEEVCEIINKRIRLYQEE